MADKETDAAVAENPPGPESPAGHGGARAGAGRKPTADKFESEIAAAKRKIADRLPEIVDNLLTLAKGVTLFEVDSDGEERVYTKAPDRNANIYLVNRILGSPLQAVDVTSGGEPLSLKANVDELRKLPADELVRLHRAALGPSE